MKYTKKRPYIGDKNLYMVTENPKNKKVKFFVSLFVNIAALLAIIGCTIMVVSIQSSIAEKKAELTQLNTQIEAYVAENEDLRRVLNSGDIDVYMEKLAREEYGYAYPDEYRFYDTSKN